MIDTLHSDLTFSTSETNFKINMKTNILWTPAKQYWDIGHQWKTICNFFGDFAYLLSFKGNFARKKNSNY